MRDRIVILFILIFAFIVPIKSAGDAIPADSIEKEHEAVATRILQHTTIYLTEGLSGFSVTACGSYVWLWTIFMAYESGIDDELHDWGQKFYYIGMPIGTAMGTWYMGELLSQKGSLAGALIGAAFGAAIGIRLSKRKPGQECLPLEWWCASVGATIGFNYKEILKFDPYSIRGMLLYCVISCTLPYLMHYLTTVGLW